MKKDKKDSKSQKQQKRIQQEQRLEKQQRQKEQHQRQLAKHTSPLIQMGLIDSYQYFLTQLAQSGIPQYNLYEFAAQSILKYQKNSKKVKRQLMHINSYNHQILKQGSQAKSPRSSKKPIKGPQLLPFKSQITPQEKLILQKNRDKNKSQSP